MTIVNGIEIDNIQYHQNNIKHAIENNDPIEEKLHVIAVVSNPCMFAKRYILMKEFIQRMELDEKDVILYIVELAYGDQSYYITDKKNPRHLQLCAQTPIWHKENMINLGVRYLLPKKWKAFAWIDADIEFESSTWAVDTLKILNGSRDIVQLFSHAVDMNTAKEAMNIFTSAGFQYEKGNPYRGVGVNYWHPGFAWAMTRKAFDNIGGLYERGILGSGDNIMMMSLIGNGMKSIHDESTENYKKDVLDLQKKMQKLRFGYVPGVIRHFYHGSKKNRKYQERWQILLRHGYDPSIHVENDKKGLLVPTLSFPKEMKDEIYEYFKERNEDEE
jgi:hypothetical protein